MYRVTIKCNGGNGVELNSADQQVIVLAPNPAENYFSVNSSVAIENVTIFNMMGQILLAEDSNFESIQISLPAGVYSVKIQTADGKSTVKKLQVK